MDTKLRPWRAVVFIVFCLGLLAFIYLLVYRVDFGGATRVTVRFAAVGTIQAGSPVRQSGVKVGSVSRVQLAADDRSKVDVELSLYRGVSVHGGDHISIVTGGLLGDQYIDIAAGGGGEVLPEGARVEGSGGLDLKVLVDGGGSLLQELGATSRTIAGFLANHQGNLDRILADAERGVRAAANAAERADRLLQKAETVWDPSLTDLRSALANLKDASVSLQTLAGGLGAPGTVGALLAQPATGQRAADILQSVRAAAASLQTVTAALEKALK